MVPTSSRRSDASFGGSTVEITSGSAEIGGRTLDVIDTPGTNTLIPQSEDEKVTRDVILASPGADIVQVGDLKNLRRTLFLSLQIAEYGVPFTLCLNMSDEARERDSEVDPASLAQVLGIPVVATSALLRPGTEAAVLSFTADPAPGGGVSAGLPVGILRAFYLPVIRKP